MSESDGRPGPARDRRSFLATAGAVGAASVGVGLAGCLGSSERVSVLAAGSLAVVFEDAIGQTFEAETDAAYQGEYHGANAVMRMVEGGRKHPDVVVSADVDLLRDRLYPDHATWDVEFAANEVGIAYDPDTDLGERLEAGEPWYEVFADAGDDEIAISDPDLDPLGYRALHLFELAAEEHDLPDFREELLETVYREPNEPALLEGVDSGNRACAVAYRNMAVEHDVPFLELPDAYNFGNPDPEYESRYAEATYETDEGYETTGSPVIYNATVRRDCDNPDGGEAFVRHLLESSADLEERGFRVPAALPRSHDEVPEGVVP
ncbi:substrate-binding domain-containing protein [Natrialbaceae archaeon GCM10025810]|uniref:substrate-binding domain-containing protein n=1 Tax=Halovalidus salilacus TaxID=3075124 RepID=UPI003609C103